MATRYNCWIIYIVCGGFVAKLSDSFDSMDWNPPGSSVRGISQARVLEWAAISSTTGTPDPEIEPMFTMSPALQADSLSTELSWKPPYIIYLLTLDKSYNFGTNITIFPLKN